jgi:hypothetical protein
MAISQPDKRNLFRELKAEYSQPKAPKLIEIGAGGYLAADGQGGPGDDLFQERVGALYAMAYTTKFACKAAGADFVVGKLETLYGIDQSLDRLAKLPKDQWRWRMLIRVPEFVTEAHMTEARAALLEKDKPGDFDAVRLEPIEEGSCVQMLHVGPYDQEQRTVEAMRTFCTDHELEPRLWHHEIYLSDPRRVPPGKLKTILRWPVEGVNPVHHEGTKARRPE